MDTNIIFKLISPLVLFKCGPKKSEDKKENWQCGQNLNLHPASDYAENEARRMLPKRKAVLFLPSQSVAHLLFTMKMVPWYHYYFLFGLHLHHNRKGSIDPRNVMFWCIKYWCK